MQLRPDELLSRARPVGRLGRLVQFPLMRMLIAVLVLALVLAVNKAFKAATYPAIGGLAVIVMRYLEACVFAGLFLMAYGLYTKLVEKRPAMELGTEGWFQETGAGFLISAAVVSVVTALLVALGFYHVASWNDTPRVAIDLLVRFSMGGLMEELLFRLVLFKLTEELLGSWPALTLLALLFGFSHLGNSNATVMTSLAVAVVGGLPYTLAYMNTRRIWFPLGLHLAWNYFQTGIFGMPNSGFTFAGLIIPKVTGPAWLTGGAFGIEASTVAIVLWSIASAVLLVRALRRGQWVPLLGTPPRQLSATGAAGG